jgi:predicted solute-binding protein
MSDDVFVPVSFDLLEIVYNVSHNIPMALADVRLRNGDGALAFSGNPVAILYGISFSRSTGKYCVFATFGGTEFLDYFDTLIEVFTGYALNYEQFRYIDMRELNRVALERRLRRKEAASARTNNDT